MFAHELDANVGEIANDRIDIATDITHFGEFGCFDLDKGCIGQPGEAPRDLGFADTGRANHQNILWGDLVAQGLGHLLAPPAVAQRNCDRPLCTVLTDDVTIELGDDFGRCHLHHRAGSAHPSITSITW